MKKEEVTMSYYFEITQESGDNEKFSRKSNKTLVETVFLCLRLVEFDMIISKYYFFYPSFPIVNVFCVFAISSHYLGHWAAPLCSLAELRCYWKRSKLKYWADEERDNVSPIKTSHVCDGAKVILFAILAILTQSCILVLSRNLT